MPFRFMRKKSKKRAQRSFSYSLPTTDPKKAKMAAELKNKEHEVGKERRDSIQLKTWETEWKAK